MKIPIYHKKYETVDLIIDEEDYEKIKNYKWRQNRYSNKYTTYIITEIKKDNKYLKRINIHRLIMGLGDFKDDKRIVNHINGNGLDNRKSNLEICSIMYNSQSINKPNQNLGSISYEKDRKKYRFTITINKKRHRKRFNTIEEAKNYRKEYLKSIYNDELLNRFNKNL